MMRIGFGYDLHCFESTKTKTYILLGGITIPHERGIVAHSDGDLCLHAIIDALLGSLALGDIGQHFPDTDPTYKNANSGTLLQNVVQKLHHAGYVVSNIDVTIIAEKPKLQPYIVPMRESIAALLQIPVQDVSVKAKTNEGVDAVGRKEAIAAHACVLVRKDQP